MIFADKLKRPVVVYWPINRACGAAFSELFAAIPGVEIVEGDAKSLEYSWNRLTQTLQFTLRKLLGHAILLSGQIKKSPFTTVEMEKTRSFRELLIRTDHAFQYPERFNMFCPIQDLESRINDCSRRFGDATIGLHIRRGDHKQAIDVSPLGGFEHHISEQLAAQADATFYLCTDCEDTRHRLYAKFGESILMNDHRLTRENTDGMKNAVVELWSLARCHDIWGSMGSSFSETAFHLGGRRPLLKFVQGMDLVSNSG